MPTSNVLLDYLPTVRKRASLPNASLPPPDTKHWLARHKAQVVAAVSAGALDLEEACQRYALTPDEFASWQEAVTYGGTAALSVRQMHDRRRASRRNVREPAVALLSPEVGIKCFITDISTRGAKLEFKSSAALPRVFELRCSSTGRSLRVNVVWQRDRVVGISFETAASWAIDAGVDTWLLGERS